MSVHIKIVVLGAQGMVGQAMLEVLASRMSTADIRAAGTQRAVDAGETVRCGTETIDIEAIDTIDFSDFDVVLSALPADAAHQWVPKAVAAGCLVVDNSAAFRAHADVPLVVPEVNGVCLAEQPKLVANPNCSTIQLCMALKPLYDQVGIERVNVATYQSVSGAGHAGMASLAAQTTDVLNGCGVTPDHFEAPIAFNVIPKIDGLNDNGYTREEMKLHDETQKIFEDERLLVNATAVRVPVFHGHAEAVHCECAEPLHPEDAKNLFKSMPGVALVEDSACLTPVTHASEDDRVWISRVRADITHPHGLNFWVVADNILKGGALNAVQIVEKWYYYQSHGVI